MNRRPLFSTFRQGENRVTGSIIAVFERLDLETLRTILASASGNAEMELVRFELQPTSARAPTVPDARIAASFDYLFETKTAFNAITDQRQIAKHLAHFSQRSDVDERLFVVTPDPVLPAALAGIDSRVVWFSFKMLDAAILDALRDEAVPEDERLLLRADERLLLRELHAFLTEEGLLGREEVVIVAAGWAYGFYRDTGAYVCQSGRTFRPGLTHLGFYRAKQIEPEIARIVYHEDNVLFTRAEIAARRAQGSPDRQRLADLIEGGLTSGTHVDGAVHQVFLLSRIGDPETITLDQPVQHTTPGPWLRRHRYAYLQDLSQARTTDDV